MVYSLFMIEAPFQSLGFVTTSLRRREDTSYTRQKFHLGLLLTPLATRHAERIQWGDNMHLGLASDIASVFVIPAGLTIISLLTQHGVEGAVIASVAAKYSYNLLAHTVMNKVEEHYAYKGFPLEVYPPTRR